MDRRKELQSEAPLDGESRSPFAFLGRRLVRLLLVLGLLLFTMFALTGTARAQTIVRGDSVPAGTTVESDALLSGDEVSIDGRVIGDALVVGSSVEVNGEVDGSLIAIGQEVVINGQVGGNVYALAVSPLELGPEASIGRTVYFIGGRLVTDPESEIGRDLVAVALGAQIGGSVGRDVNAIVGLVQILDRLFRAADAVPGELLSSAEPGQSASPAIAKSEQGRPLSGRRSTLARRLSSASVYQEPDAQAPTFSDWTVRRVSELVSFLIVGGLAAWLFPGPFTGWAGKLRERPLASGGLGMVAYISGFFGAFIIGLLILAAGLLLRLLTLKVLALTFWAIGFSGLGLAFSTFVLFVLFMSKVVVSYLIGYQILKRLFPRAAGRKFWPLLLGLLIYVLLRSIPIAGWIISVIVTFLGLGAVWLWISSRGSEYSELALEEE
jgi:cytoskeletal protein CcmA (bactofilin family)